MILLDCMNKKIKNARELTINNIHFKSKLEANFYKTLLQYKLNVQYEPKKFTLIEGFTPTIPFYNRNSNKEFIKDMRKVRAITYTPDFIVYYKKAMFIIEGKGVENDVFPLKKKLFRRLLETMDIPCFYFEVRTKKELLEVISIIKSYEIT